MQGQDKENGVPTVSLPHSTFISHAHADNDLCDPYATALRSQGIDVWYDRTNTYNGQLLAPQISVQLERRTALVALVSPAALNSFWVNLEIGAFLNLKSKEQWRVLLPVRIAECDIPALLAGLLWLDAVSLGFEATIPKIAAALGASAYRLEDAEDLRRQGKRLVEESRYKEALDAYDRALLYEPRNSTLWRERGRALRGLGIHEQELESYEKCLSLDPTDVTAWILKGLALRWFGREHDAVAAFECAIVIDPTDIRAWGAKAVALRSLGRQAEADEAYRQVRELRRRSR